jgi:hypothetical protein
MKSPIARHYLILTALGLGLLPALAAPIQASNATEANTGEIAQAWGIVSDGPTDSPASGISEPTAELAQQRQLIAQNRRYSNVIQQTANLVSDSAAQSLASRFGLNILNVTWEDTGRYKGSSVGPNISDMTIQVQQQDSATGQYNLSLMPVIRKPNFSDETADVDLDKFFVLVGNEKGQDLQRISLRELLGDVRSYLHEPDSWKGNRNSLLAPRDSHVLTSAQAAFLPIPEADNLQRNASSSALSNPLSNPLSNAQFNPVLFNYQSYKDNPAVLTILATREGTSMTVIDNTRDGFAAGQTWGQRLFFNKDGERASFTGQRLSDYNQNGDGRGNGGSDNPAASEKDGLNMVVMIQVPLKQKEQPRQAWGGAMGDNAMLSEAAPAAAPMESARAQSNVEAAVIGHGEVEGPFTEIDNLAIERDPRFPIRATVQFYKATSNGVVSEQDMQQIHDQIAQVYSDADYVGSLVTGGDSNRPTEYEGSKQQPPGWWSDFWKRHGENTSQSPLDVQALWQRLLGQG